MGARQTHLKDKNGSCRSSTRAFIITALSFPNRRSTVIMEVSGTPPAMTHTSQNNRNA